MIQYTCDKLKPQPGLNNAICPYFYIHYTDLEQEKYKILSQFQLYFQSLQSKVKSNCSYFIIGGIVWVEYRKDQVTWDLFKTYILLRKFDIKKRISIKTRVRYIEIKRYNEIGGASFKIATGYHLRSKEIKSYWELCVTRITCQELWPSAEVHN